MATVLFSISLKFSAAFLKSKSSSPVSLSKEARILFTSKAPLGGLVEH